MKDDLKKQFILMGVLVGMLIITVVYGMIAFEKIGYSIGTKKAAEASEKIEEYTRLEDYMGLYGYLEKNDIYTSYNELENYELVLRANRVYGNAVQDLESIVYPAAYSDVQKQIEYFADDLNYFLNIDPEGMTDLYKMDNDLNLGAYEGMLNELSAMTKSVFRLTDEEWQTIVKSSDIERKNLLTEAYNDGRE